jgi:hypothetical protein
MEDMASRKSPVRTLGCLTANLTNGQKCTSPSSAAGKARVALNALKHGGHTDPAGAGKSFSRRARPRTGRYLGEPIKWPPWRGVCTRQWAYEQSRNVLEFQGDYARDYTFSQGFVSRNLKCYPWVIVAQFENVTRHGHG